MNKFQNEDQLQDWLNEANIDTSLWGEGNAKTVSHLWAELLAGETRIQGGPPLRLVDVVQITIRRGDQILIEVAQELEGGQHRFRNLLPSEKMKANESYAASVLRGLREELDVEETAVALLHHTYTKNQSERDSPSYPGLPTLYTFHSIEAQVLDLPENDFWIDNTARKVGDPVKRHQWGWRINH